MSSTLEKLGSTTCQVSRWFQSRETAPTRFRTSSASLFQSVPWPWRSLLITTGDRPLARKSRAKLVEIDRVALVLRAPPEAVELVLVVDELLGPFAIPVVVAEEADAAEPAGPFEAVEVIVFPLLAGAEVLADLEVGGDPANAGLEVGVGRALAAVLDAVVADEPLGPPEPLEAADDQAGDPRAGHAGGRAVGGVGGVGPAPVALLVAAASIRGRASRPRP